MILAWDNGWVIYTPTKTGTYSLEGTLIDVLDLAVKIKPRHRMDRPYDGNPTRLMVVRDPLERWCSIYWAIHRWSKSGHPYLWQFSESPETFAWEYFQRCDHKPWPMYTNNNYDNAKLVVPHFVFKIEELHKIMEHLGQDPAKLKHLNHTKDRPSVEKTLAQLTPEMRKRVLDWARPDQETFGYATQP